jgi:hypothetical protein
VALMRTVQDIAFGVTGQSIYFDAPEGRPSAVTSVEVFPWDASDGDDSESEAIGSGSVETNPNTTIDAASGFGQTDAGILNVAATTGFEEGRRYLVTSADAYREWFDVLAIDSANTVTAKHPLHNAYAASDTVQTTRIQATVDATWIADDTNLREPCANPMYRVRWVYVVSGVTYVADSYFNVVRYPAAHGVRPQDVEAMHPGWLDRLPTDHRTDQGRRLISEAHRTVKIDMHAAGVDDSSVAETEVVDDLVRWKTLELGELANVMSGNSDGRAYEFLKSQYQQRLDTFIRITLKVPIRDASGAASQRTALGITRR